MEDSDRRWNDSRETEVHVTVEDGGTFDLSETEKEIKIAVVLG